MNTQDFFANINELAAQIHQNNVEKGFWEGERDMDEVFMLIISELSEALEAHRKDKRVDLDKIKEMDALMQSVYFGYEKEIFKTYFEAYVKDTFEDELGDSVIRILDCAGKCAIKLLKSPMTTETWKKKSVPARLFSITKMICKASSTYKQMSLSNLTKAIHELFQIADQCEIDLPKQIEWKVAYNKHHRPYKHGKKY